MIELDFSTSSEAARDFVTAIHLLAVSHHAQEGGLLDVDYSPLPVDDLIGAEIADRDDKTDGRLEAETWHVEKGATGQPVGRPKRDDDAAVDEFLGGAPLDVIATSAGLSQSQVRRTLEPYLPAPRWAGVYYAKLRYGLGFATQKQAAADAGIDVQTLRRYRPRGKMPKRPGAPVVIELPIGREPQAPRLRRPTARPERERVERGRLDPSSDPETVADVLDALALFRRNAGEIGVLVHPLLEELDRALRRGETVDLVVLERDISLLASLANAS